MFVFIPFSLINYLPQPEGTVLKQVIDVPTFRKSTVSSRKIQRMNEKTYLAHKAVQEELRTCHMLKERI